MPLQSKILWSWEQLFLGERPAWTTSRFWQCVVAATFPFAVMLESALRLRIRRPDLFGSVWPVYLALAVLCLYSEWSLLMAIRKRSAGLKAAKGSPQYDGLLEDARDKAIVLIRTAFAYALGVLILEMLAILLSNR